MRVQQRADAIDTRFVFRAYAVLAGPTGFALLFGGDFTWLGGGKAGFGGVLGSVLVATGCFAAALAGVEDPLARRRGLLWLAAGHAIVWLGVLSQLEAIWGPGRGELAGQLLFGFTWILLYLWASAEGEGRERDPLTRLLQGRAAAPLARPLRSQYERQIREAATQEERNRLARDLHDSIKQQLFVIQTAAATVQARFEGDPEGAKMALEQVRSSAREAVTEMEAMLDQLRAAPLGIAGLVEAVKKQCEALGFRTGARVEFKLGTLPPSEALTPGAQQAILRVAQEALANVGRHARARNVTVALDATGRRFELWVRDDGSGYDQNQASGGMGIANMHARAEEFGGTLEVGSYPGRGTWVHFEIPCAAQTPNEHRQRVLVTQSGRRTGAIDTRLMCRAYAVLAGPTGIALFVWGPTWLGAGTAGLVRVYAAVLLAAGCFAAALSGVEDRLARRRSLGWFAAAHFVILLGVISQRKAVWRRDRLDVAAQSINFGGLFLYWLWRSARGINARGGLPSLYERQIREAASQEERSRLVRELHGSIKQQLSVIQTAAATVQARFEGDPEGAKMALEQVRSSAREAMNWMEAMLDQLRAVPLGNAGLVEAVKKQCEALGFRTGARVEFKLGTLPPGEALAPGAQQAILRVAQEALANVGRHARRQERDRRAGRHGPPLRTLGPG